MTATRVIAPMPLPTGLAPGPVGPPPEVRWVDPRGLLIEDGYQRTLSERSAALIHRIVTEFDWRAFKPPIVAETEGGRLAVIDGQHTAIGAASHPEVGRIPVLVVAASEMIDRAKAFLRHNRDRVAMTPMQIHHAAVAAGDEVAVALSEAADRAKVRILRSPSASPRVGDTMAVSTLRTICERRGVGFTARVLRILAEAGQCPIDATSIKAVNELLTDPDWKDQISGESLSLTIRAKSIEDWLAWTEANIRKGQKIPKARALAIAWFQRTPKRRRP